MVGWLTSLDATAANAMFGASDTARADLKTSTCARRYARQCASDHLVPEPVRSLHDGARIMTNWETLSMCALSRYWCARNGRQPYGCSILVLETGMLCHWEGGRLRDSDARRCEGNTCPDKLFVMQSPLPAESRSCRTLCAFCYDVGSVSNARMLTALSVAELELQSLDRQVCVVDDSSVVNASRRSGPENRRHVAKVIAF